MFIQTEDTGNPSVVRFLPGRDVTGSRTVAFAEAGAAKDSPLAVRLFAVEGVAAVSLGPDHVAVTKADGAEWPALRPAVLRALMEHFTADEPVFAPGGDPGGANGGDGGDDEVVAQIRELIDSRIYPAVSQSGGDVVFRGFEDGVVLLDMQGPAVAMQTGIENMLRHYVPEVREVQSYEEHARLAKPEMNTPQALAIRRVLDDEINPSVSAHGGHIALMGVEGDTAYIRLEGGCQGCGMADVTLKQGIETSIRQTVPSIAAVLDVTDHAGGTNPYYQPGKGGASPY